MRTSAFPHIATIILGIAGCSPPGGMTASNDDASSPGEDTANASSGASTGECSDSDCTDAEDDTTSGGAVATTTSSTTSVGTTSGGNTTTGGTSSTSGVATWGTTTSGSTSTSTSGGETSDLDTGGEEETGDPGETCPLPATFRWTSTGPLTEPKNTNAVALKDFSVARNGDRYIVYGTTPDGNWNGFMSSFSSFDEWADVEQHYIPGMVAPTILYFEPKDIWVLAYQWGFQYATSSTPEDPDSWSRSTSLMTGDPTEGRGTGPIDQTIICDDTDCYIFFNDDAGGVYRASMPIDAFPGTFTGAQRIMDEDISVIFEGVQVYSIKGSDQYLMINENVGVRTFRAWIADDLGGEWRPLAGADTIQSPFAGEANVTWPDGQWTRDISHGDLVRENPNEKMEIDPCNLQMLYQGRDPNQNVDYINLPYRPGLLTLQR